MSGGQPVGEAQLQGLRLPPAAVLPETQRGPAAELSVPKKKKDLAKELGVSRTTLWRMRKRQEAAREREDGER